MKKINLVFYITFLILTFLSCRSGESLKDYIEKGFSKPIIGDPNIKFEKIGIRDDGEICVPSGKDIEVQFTIKNKYNQELTGKIEIPENKKALFEKTPEIKELTPTKMAIAFNFKAEAEPKAINHFLGETVGMTVKIFEKRQGRFLSSQNLVTCCNTPPPSNREN